MTGPATGSQVVHTQAGPPLPAPRTNSEKTPTIGDRQVKATEKFENSQDR